MTAASDTELGDVRSFTVSRLFAAPCDAVFRLWTDPACVREWWGIEGSTNPVCELDVRPGGTWRIDMRTAGGRVYRNQGVYLEVVENVRLVFTDVPDTTLPEWQDTPPEPSVHTVTFVESEGRTLVTLEVRFASKGDRDRLTRLGMPKGIAESFDRLERLLETAIGRHARRAPGHQ